MGEKKAAVFCVGNRLMLDEGVGPAVYDAVLRDYEVPENVRLFDVGCMSLDMLPYVESYDVIITVDAVDGTDDAPGTVYRFSPDAMARHSGAMASLHDLKLVDLFDAASLLGYEAEGYCLGMQVANMSPSEYAMDLTERTCARSNPSHTRKGTCWQPASPGNSLRPRTQEATQRQKGRRASNHAARPSPRNAWPWRRARSGTPCPGHRPCHQPHRP